MSRDTDLAQIGVRARAKTRVAEVAVLGACSGSRNGV